MARCHCPGAVLEVLSSIRCLEVTWPGYLLSEAWTGQQQCLCQCCLAADTVGDLGYAQELGNYGEYSGAPNTAETYQYAKTVLECVTANPDGRGRALLIGGGIANFTGRLDTPSRHKKLR
eukprot:GHUV01050822.1.p1 GENE.GHUV01050822.1~~GHUV01050822.1.p1  ORF type:complete len:120 (-),score=12.04 GHUV01050822.1:50-409(-)